MMELEADSAQKEVVEPLAFLPFPHTRWGRVLYGLFITLLPAFSFWATHLLKPDWQDGKVRSYVSLLLSPEAAWLFFPLLIYSIVCYLLLLRAPERFARSFVVRFGIYTGILLALQYSILILFLIEDGIYLLVLTWIFPVIFSAIHRWAVARWTAHRVNKALLIFVVVTLLLVSLIARENMWLWGFILLLAGAPFWSFLISGRAALWLFKNHETGLSLPRDLGIAAWLSAYIVAWRFDILKMYELYTALPKEPPNCYIATAAARGHPQVVQAWTVRRADGRSVQVNRQLQKLKCAELALMAVLPRLHRFLRYIYDVVGMNLANRISNPCLADAAYLLLKPWEWLVGFILKLIVPEIDSLSKKMYL